MEAAVLNRMRNILVVYRDTWRGETNRTFGWGDLAAMIIEHTLESTGKELDFPKNSLENFARGLPHPDQEKREAGIVKYSTPGPERLQAIILFLTEPESDGFFCSKEELFSLADLQAPVYLLDFLHNKQSPDHYLSASLLKGEFVSTDSDSEIDIKTTLQFLGATSNSLVQIDIMKEAVDQGETFEKYVGWGVISPEENLLIIAKKLKSNQNLYFWSLGIDQAVYQISPPEKINTLVFLEHDFPVDAVVSGPDDDDDFLLNAVKETWAQQIRVFKRAFPSSTNLTIGQRDSNDE